jgi:SAM-dependent methyltransferase
VSRERPQGAVTRGTTNPNRLRRLDRWIVHRMGAALRADPEAVVVDLGFGGSPVTTLELAQRLSGAAHHQVRVVGVEIDPDRVAAAAHLAGPGLEFRCGGFEVPLEPGARPLVIRAANVLRQYPQADVAPAWATMSRRLAPGGLLVEGTCDELGRLAAWVALAAPPRTSPAPPGRPAPAGEAADPPVPESLTLSVDLARLGRPSDVAPRLPKALIHRNVPGQGVHALLAALDAAWERSAPLGVFGPRQRWQAMAAMVRDDGWPVRDGPNRWRLGELGVAWHAVAPAPAPGNG